MSPPVLIASGCGKNIPACYIRDAVDALVLLSAFRQGRFPQCRGRFSRDQQLRYIKSGWTVIYTEKVSGVARWRDQYSWSHSRTQGPFFIYRELPEGSPRRVTRCSIPATFSVNPADEPYPEEIDWNDLVFDYTSVATLADNAQFSINGLCKKTCTLELFDEVYHLVSYYSPLDVHLNILPRASAHEFFKDHPILPEVLFNTYSLMRFSMVGDSYLLTNYLGKARLQSIEEQLAGHRDGNARHSPDSRHAGDPRAEVNAEVPDEITGAEKAGDTSSSPEGIGSGTPPSLAGEWTLGSYPYYTTGDAPTMSSFQEPAHATQASDLSLGYMSDIVSEPRFTDSTSLESPLPSAPEVVPHEDAYESTVSFVDPWYLDQGLLSGWNEAEPSAYTGEITALNDTVYYSFANGNVGLNDTVQYSYTDENAGPNSTSYYSYNNDAAPGDTAYCFASAGLAPTANPGEEQQVYVEQLSSIGGRVCSGDTTYDATKVTETRWGWIQGGPW